MNQEFSFETIPLEVLPELEDELYAEAFETEHERGGGRRTGASGRGRSTGRPISRAAPTPRSQPVKRPLPSKYRPYQGRYPWERTRSVYGVIREPYTVMDEPVEPAVGSERLRWVQDCLNQALNLQLPITGVLGPTTRSAVRNFQKQQGLRVSGIVDTDTEAALKAACGEQTLDDGSSSEFGVGKAVDQIAKGLKQAYTIVANKADNVTGPRIIDLTGQSNKSNRKGNRHPKSVYALVLHQMACCAKRKDPLKDYLNVNSHFAILQDGTILQLHPIQTLLWASNGFNKHSIAVEFAGNFPDIHDKWWKTTKYNAGRDRPTSAQFEAGRYLIRYLINTMGLTHVYAHRQSSGTRENDPGPDIWSQVGQWAVNNLDLKDGGKGYKIDSGNPIPEVWRKWTGSSTKREIGSRFENESLGQFASQLTLEENFSRQNHEFGKNISDALQHAKVALPNFRSAGPLTSSTIAVLKGPGLYVIKSGGKPYVGQTTDLQARLRQHLWCATHLGLPTEHLSVFVAEYPAIAGLPTTEQQRRLRAQEKSINAVLVPKGLVNNQRAELEQELWGSAWH